MGKKATTVDEQIEILESRGLHIGDKDKAKEILQDIGYYRLGFYLFPFEKSYPGLKNRTHEYIEGATFEDAVFLYYFDFDLRLILSRYLNRIEIAFRTELVYYLSNKYKENSIWFADKSILDKQYVADFEKKVYNSDFRRYPSIRRHHQAYPNDRFAPAWKTLEFMTFGAVLKLYENLKEKEDKIHIANKFGVRQIVTFENYMHTIRQVRNACAHGLLLYDLQLIKAIRKGPAKSSPSERNNLIGALKVIKYIMSYISANRVKNMKEELEVLYDKLCQEAPFLKPLILNLSKI
ncbi:MAG: Abi family protein [Muribaculaceae bacterium]|nr:Abi family protein [Muribaculaceae bacterium]